MRGNAAPFARDHLMTRAELLRAVSAKVGRPIQACTLQYAQLTREVDLGDRMADGWRNYNDKHVEQLTAYVKSRSHRARNRTLPQN
jgi:hypothetical protein